MLDEAQTQARLTRLFDRPKHRNMIECMFGWLTENRRIVTRFDKFIKSYAAMVSLAFSMRFFAKPLCVQSLGSLSAHCSSIGDRSVAPLVSLGGYPPAWVAEKSQTRLGLTYPKPSRRGGVSVAT